MKKKKGTALFLALLMVASVFLNATSVFAESGQPVPETNQPIKNIEEVEVEKNALEDVKVEESGLEIREEEVPEPVGEPDGFDLSTINTIAKDKDGNFYGVKTYENRNGNTDSFKIYYKITEDQYNEVAKDCFMIFKREDGQAFALNGVKISTSHIDANDSGVETPAGPIFTEIQFRHHSAYDGGFLVNNSPIKVHGQEKLTWYIKLKKDWLVERDPKFYDDTGWCYAFVNFNVVVDGDGHTIYRNDDQQKAILWAGFGTNGLGAEERTANIKNLTIDGSNKYCCVIVSEKGVLNLENVTIQNGYADKNHKYFGGAIKLDSEAKLTMDADTTINNCKANMGGAIRLLGKNTLTINGSTLLNNQADLGGAICTTKDDCTINITGATFDGNKAVNTITDEYLHGGAIYTNSPLKISDTTFKNNFANKNGGAITSNADTTISECDFIENKSIGNNGGAIYQGEDKLEVKDSNFTKNESPLSGGAIYVLGKTDIKDTKFSENRAKWGGAIANFSNLSIKNATFEKNEATSTGGAIYTSKGIKVEDSSFIENKANNGGAIYLKSGESRIIKSTFSKNESINGGGAIFIAHNSNGTTSISNSSFTGNASMAFGGGIYQGINGNLDVNNSEFTKNQAAYGGGISSAAGDSNTSELTIKKCNFAGNIALQGGGVFTAFPTEIIGTTFIKNEARLHPKDDKSNPHISGVGGAIEVMDNKIVIKSSTFEENLAYGSGGAIGINGVARDKNKNIATIKPDIKVEISDGTKFIGNTCGVGQGGAIFTIPYLYDIKGYKTGIDEDILKEQAYSKLSTAKDTVFKDNVATSGYFDPPTNYARYKDLAFDRNSFTDLLPNKDVAKSLLNNYDVNYINNKISIIYNSNGGEPKEKVYYGKISFDEKEMLIIPFKHTIQTLEQTGLKKNGLTFKGWNTKADASGDWYTPGEAKDLKSNLYLYAIWEKPEPKPEPKPQENVYTPFFYTAPALNKEDHYQYLIGYKDDTFRPENNMTREEVAVMFSRLLKNPPTKGKIYNYNFTDVEKNRWSTTAISYMSELGIIKGYPDGTFRPQASITRAEFASIATKFAELKEGNKTFSDLDRNHWAYEIVSRAATAGWINGYPDGTFKPDNKITRAEVVSITNLMLNRKADEKYVDNNLDKLLKYSDVTKNHWAYYKIFEATNGHDFVRQSNKIDEEWKDITNKSFVYDK